MQAKQEQFFDWHQQLIVELLKAPLVKSRSGLAFTSIGHLLKFDLTKEFPATKAKRLQFDTVARELYCFLKGYNTREQFHAHGLHIWDANMDAIMEDNIGDVYGKVWRDASPYEYIDQLKDAIDLLKKSPETRRALVSGWDIFRTPQAPVPSCHCMFQFNIVDGILYTDVYQRSADLFLGLPFDVAEYAILSRLVANELGLSEERLNYHIANLHLYHDHFDAALQELTTTAETCAPYIDCLSMTVDDFDYNKIELNAYPKTIKSIKAKMNV